MYANATLLYPVIGKGLELQAILEERIRARQAQGVRVGLQVVVYGPNTPAFRIVNQFEDLAGLEADRQQFTPDPRIPGLMRQPPQTSLWELLLAVQPGGPTPKYVHAFINRPLPGKGPELAALLVENARKAQDQGHRSAVSIQVAGPAAGAVRTQTLYGSLSEFEKRRASNRADPAMQQFLAKMNVLLATTATSAISEVLVPMVPRA